MIICGPNSLSDTIDSINYVSGCTKPNGAGGEHGLGYECDYYQNCVTGNSEILCVPYQFSNKAEDMKEGQDIAYYNSKTDKVEIGIVEKVYIHKNAKDFVRYTFEDGTFLEATSYHPIYTKEGWKSYTRRNGYPVPQEGNEVKTPTGWKKLTKIETYEGLEDCYDFSVITKEGKKVDNYYANGTLVQSSIN